MPEPFKLLINAQTVTQTAEHLRRHLPEWDGAAFSALALDGLDGLELKARAMHLADALQQCLPVDFERAASAVEAALAPAVPADTPASHASNAAGLRGWVVWSLGEWVARSVAADACRLPRGLMCLHALTQRFSAEFAIRPLLRDHPEAVFQTLSQWATDPSAHVRRLASEGSRPRLPWGLRLQALVKDPSPCWPLLRALQDDPSAYVRRSVANHLNDIAKDHPDAVAAWVACHLPGASATRRALLRHASRSLIKQGHAATLAAWGQGQPLVGSVHWQVSPAQVRTGESVQLQVQLVAPAGGALQTLVLDYGVLDGRTHSRNRPKVFKGWNLQLAPGEHRTLQRQHAMKPITTRRLVPGPHRVSLQVNGHIVAEAQFELLADCTD